MGTTISHGPSRVPAASTATSAMRDPSGETAGGWLGTRVRPSGNVSCSRITGFASAALSSGARAMRPPSHITVVAIATSTQTRVAIGHACRLRYDRDPAADAVADGAVARLSAIHFNSSVKSRALCHRSSGSLARHFLTLRSRADGVSGWLAAIGGGSCSRIAATRLAWLFPSNAFFPVAIS
jgi:hypothetical protein